jgi:hypothetical protein
MRFIFNICKKKENLNSTAKKEINSDEKYSF